MHTENRMTRLTMLTIVAALCLASCASPTLLRWREGDPTGLTDAKSPSLSITSQAADPDTPLTAKTLPERAAAAYIRALAAQSKDPSKLRALMATPIRKGDSGSAANDLPRVMVIDVQRNGVRPADRFMMTEVDVKPTMAPAGPDYVFTDYQAASTANSNISIGTVSVTNQTTGTLSATPTIAAASLGAASYSVQSTNASTHNISETTQLSVNAMPTLVTVVRTGGEGVDLVGNTLVKLTVHLPEASAFPIFVADTDLFEDDGSRKPPAKAKVTITPTQFVAAHDIYACAKLKYVDRQVESGTRYRDEGHQTVKFFSDFVDWTPFLLVPKADMQSSVWLIMSLSAEMKPEIALEMDSELGWVPLYFDNYDKAQAFRAWVAKERTTSVGGHDLSLGGLSPITRFDRLIVIRYSDNAPNDALQTCPKSSLP